MSRRMRFALLFVVVLGGCAAAFVFGVAALAIEPPSQCNPITDHEGVCADPSLLYGTISVSALFAAIVAVLSIFKPRDKA
jgi:hypothetical protein